jgi:hypothetical protein
MTRGEALIELRSLTPIQREAIIFLIENQEAEGNWGYSQDDGSIFEDSVSSTLSALALVFKE